MRSAWPPISDQTWAAIRTEFTLPSLEQVQRRLSELMEDPDPVIQQLVRVFIGEGTYCPGFQFLTGGLVHPTVLELFQRAMALKIPHNHFTVWMVSPSAILAGARPVQHLEARPPALFEALEALARK